nr:uncharacterized protein LOC129272027 [Lytechinus pictus]
MESTLPMWDFVSPEDNEVLIDNFRTESKKVIDRWSLGNASTTERDAAVSFLVQLGAVRITFQSSSDHIQSERRVSFQFEDRPLLETKHDGPDTADPPPMKSEDIDREQSRALTSDSQASSSKDVPMDCGLETKHDGPDTADPPPMKSEDIDREQSRALTSDSQASSSKDVPMDCGLETKHDGSDTADPPPIKNEDIGSREQSGALTSASQASSSKDVPIDCGDDEDNENCSAWMSESSDDDDDDTVTAKEDDRSATQQPSEEHPCPNCHAILHSTWELDLHKVNDCSEDPIKYVYNCDQCTKSFLWKLKLISHLRIDHKMTPHDVIVKLEELESTKIQKGMKIKTSKKESHRRQGLRKSRAERKRQKVSGRKKKGEGSVQKMKRTRSNIAVAPPKLKSLCVRLKKIKTDDRNEFSSSSRQTRSSKTAVVSNVDIAPQNCTSNDHQNLEALDAKSTRKTAIVEVGEDEIVREEKTECKDNERPTVWPEYELSEARLLEENDHSLANSESSDDKGFTDENVDTCTPSSPTNENIKSEVLTDPIVDDTPEVMLEPIVPRWVNARGIDGIPFILLFRRKSDIGKGKFLHQLALPKGANTLAAIGSFLKENNITLESVDGGPFHYLTWVASTYDMELSMGESSLIAPTCISALNTSVEGVEYIWGEGPSIINKVCETEDNTIIDDPRDAKVTVGVEDILSQKPVHRM